MYVSPNFKSKKALKEAVSKGNQVTVFYPNNMFGEKTPVNGSVVVEGPHFPEPHKWYAKVILENGLVIKVQ